MARHIPSIAADQALSIISALSDKTRLEILSLLHNNPNGLTAADISRLINKKIPSVLYQLEILHNSGIINSVMKLVPSIGRKIKHWILLNQQIVLQLDLGFIIRESIMPMDIRINYLNRLIMENNKEKLKESDLERFDFQLLNSIDSSIFRLTEKELSKFQHYSTKLLLIDALIQKARSLIGRDGIKLDIFADILSLDKSLADLLLNHMKKSTEFYIDKSTSLIRRKLD